VNEDKSSRYHRLKRRSAVLSTLIGGGLFTALLVSGATRAVRDLAAAIAGAAGVGDAGTIAVYVIVLSALHAGLDFPIAFHDGYTLEQRYGLSSESWREWARDHAKALLVGVALALIAAEAIYAAVRVWPRAWWLPASAVLTGGIVILARLAPIALMPLFFRFKPLDREALRERLSDLSDRAGVRVLGVYEWGLGEKTRRANAALVGSGGTRRVLLSDTLLADYSDDEIEVILAHELGHHAHRDLSKALILQSAAVVAALAVAAVMLNLVWHPLGLAGPSDVAGLPVIVLTAGALMLMVTPISNALSRHSERSADRFALALTGRPSAFVSAMRRLGTQNLAEANPSRLALWLFHTHPPIDERIAAARAFAEKDISAGV
jgi:STE24 endopeptidase